MSSAKAHPCVAGGAILSLRSYLERLQGPSTLGGVLDRLPSEQAAPLRGIILPVNWYPTWSFVHALHAAEAHLRAGDFYEGYGAFAAEYEINAFQRFALRFTSPAYMLSRAGRMWHRFHDTGEWEVRGEARSMLGTLRDFGVVDARYCRVVASWIKRAGQMTGARGEVSHPECRARGAPACVFSGWWT